MSYPTIYPENKSRSLSETGILISENFKRSQEAYFAKSIYTQFEWKFQVRRMFDQLKNEWKKATAYISDTGLIVSHPAYLKIIKLGTVVIDWIIEDLVETRCQWFEALEAITGQDPIAPDHYGAVNLMIQDWQDWASKKS